MNIKLNPNTIGNIYKKNTPAPAKSGTAGNAQAAEKSNVDVISISARATEQVDASKLAKTVTADVMSQKADETRLAQLKASIEGGQYNVPSEEIAQSILKSFFA